MRVLRRACALLRPHLVVVGGGLTESSVIRQWAALGRLAVISGPVLPLPLSCRYSDPSPPFRARLLSHGCCRDMYYSELAKYLF